jgi:hypothetical protein
MFFFKQILCKSVVLAILLVTASSCRTPASIPPVAMGLGTNFKPSDIDGSIVASKSPLILTFYVDTRLSEGVVEFFGDGNSLGTQSVSVLPPPPTSPPGPDSATFKAYSWVVNLTKADNGNHIYSAAFTPKVPVVGGPTTYNDVPPITVTVNIP